MKVGDLVRIVATSVSTRIWDLGIVLEYDSETMVKGAAKYLVQFNDGEPCWMPDHQLEIMNESR